MTEMQLWAATWPEEEKDCAPPLGFSIFKDRERLIEFIDIHPGAVAYKFTASMFRLGDLRPGEHWWDFAGRCYEVTDRRGAFVHSVEAGGGDVRNEREEFLVMTKRPKLPPPTARVVFKIKPSARKRLDEGTVRVVIDAGRESRLKKLLDLR